VESIAEQIHEVMSIQEFFVLVENVILWAKGLNYLCGNGKFASWLKQLEVAISTWASSL
jgi:hypothetical protein